MLASVLISAAPIILKLRVIIKRIVIQPMLISKFPLRNARINPIIIKPPVK